MKRKSQGRKHRSIKGILGVLLLLSSTCLVSVGLSAWSLGGSINGNAGLDVSADGKLIDINTHVYYADKKDVTIFDFCKDGVVSDGQIMTTGEVIIPFKIDLTDSNDKIRNHLPDGVSSFKLSTTYTNGIVNISTFLDSYLDPNNIKLSVSTSANNINFNVAPVEKNSLSGAYKASFAINDLDVGCLYFNVKYPFHNFPVSDAFKTNVFDKLTGGRFLFNFKAEVEL